MRNLFILILCLFLSKTAIFAAVSEQNIYNISSKELSKIEKQVFGKTFAKDTPEVRIIRLEVNLLGAAQSGDLDKRIQTILTAANHLDTAYSNITDNPTYTSSWSTTPTTQTGFWNGVKNIFGTSGYMTGYTPPIAPYGYHTPYGFSPNPYYSGYHNPRLNHPSGWNRYARNNYGYYNTNQDIGSGCSVRILD